MSDLDVCYTDRKLCESEKSKRLIKTLLSIKWPRLRDKKQNKIMNTH